MVYLTVIDSAFYETVNVFSSSSFDYQNILICLNMPTIACYEYRFIRTSK